MAKNLFDFANDNSSEKMREESQNVDEKYIRAKVNEYSTMSESEMKSKLFSEIFRLIMSERFITSTLNKRDPGSAKQNSVQILSF